MIGLFFISLTVAGGILKHQSVNNRLRQEHGNIKAYLPPLSNSILVMKENKKSRPEIRPA
jgi:hypothetical protein